MEPDNFKKWQSKSYKVNYIWNNDEFFDKHLHNKFHHQEKKNTRAVIDNELMAMDLLEALVDDSANQDAIHMLTAIGIRC